ncbi:MAG: TonB-dependent receptor [Candidatus Neomarinimicrobiota bacterium]
MNRLKRIILTFSLALTSSLIAQITVSGTVTDASTGKALAGANVVVEGTNKGSAADANGEFTIGNVSNGSTLTASMIGYKDMSMDVSRTVNFSLEPSMIEMSGLEVLASRADEKTPVAYTNVSKAEMEVRLGSQEIPMVLNTTPSVYATQQGGGAGDARINVRGFNQRNVAVMINGVPQNDMENGWVYWSNWDGVGDATSSIQMQRGLSAVNLATPSIGGTMNIITDPASMERGGSFKQELGAGSFLKSSFNYNTGLIADKFAFSTTLVKKTGEGIIDKTWTDAYAYYLGSSYQMNNSNRFELYAIGAPQRHGQNLYKQNMSTYSQELANDTEGFDATAFATGEKFETEAGREFNQNWGAVDATYEGKQYWYMYGVGGLFGGGENQDRYNKDYLNERENFFHKPLVNLNHYLTLSDNMRLSSILYWSGGSGGGTGTYGSVSRSPAVEGEAWYASSPWTWDWNSEIAENSNNIDSTYSTTENRSTGILRNSINRQNTYGLISKFDYDLSSSIKLQTGLDWRTANIEHAREVRDLLGGDYYVDFADDNAPDGKVVRLGDKIAYSNTTTVDWLGFFGQGSYSSGPISAYGMVGFTTIAYTDQDSFTVAQQIVDHGDAITATQFKGGAMYDINDNMSAFANFGLVEKPPILDNVIYYDGTVASDPANEKFQNFEAGLNYRAGNLAVKTNVYYTQWKDRNLTKSVTTGQGSSGDTDVIFLSGVNQDHSGLEVEASMQVIDMLRLDAAIGLGNWKFTGDADGEYVEAEFDSLGNNTGQISTSYSYALDGLFVGDQPQTGIALGATLTPMSGLSIQALFNHYAENYSDWSPDAREIEDGEADRAQVWKAPAYSRLNLHLNYDLPVDLGGTDISLFAHVFNALDAVYVQDAVDHSQYNGYGDRTHSAHNAEVFLGVPRNFNLGLKVNF